MFMRILVVEDEKKAASYLRRGLSEAGFLVETCTDGDDGLERARHGAYDALILDVMLPSRPGWSILEELRQLGNQTPVLFLTARDAIQDRVRGLELGADDYLVKPFAFAELLARLRTIMRRAAGKLNQVLRVADLELDLVRQKATRAGKRLDLTPKEFTLLTLLAQTPGEALSRERIAREVWMVALGDSNVVDVHIRRLRSKVDDPFADKLIHTARGVGYVLNENR